MSIYPFIHTFYYRRWQASWHCCKHSTCLDSVWCIEGMHLIIMNTWPFCLRPTINDPLREFGGCVPIKEYWDTWWTRDKLARGSLQAQWPGRCGSFCLDEGWIFQLEGSLWSNGKPYLIPLRESPPEPSCHPLWMVTAISAGSLQRNRFSASGKTSISSSRLREM